MKLNRSGVAAVGLLATVLLMSGCGSDNNTTSSSGGGSSAASGDCAGKKDLKASGSTAQANAMTRFIAAYQAACPGFSLDYTSNGSGAGVSEFTGNQTDFGGSDSPLNADKGEVAAAAKRCGSDAWNLPVVFGPIAVTYNVPRRRQARTRRPHPREDLQRRHHRLERPGHREAEPRCVAAFRRRSMWSTAATSPAPPTTSRSTSPRLLMAAGPRAQARRSTAG